MSGSDLACLALARFGADSRDLFEGVVIAHSRPRGEGGREAGGWGSPAFHVLSTRAGGLVSRRLRRASNQFEQSSLLPSERCHLRATDAGYGARHGRPPLEMRSTYPSSREATGPSDLAASCHTAQDTRPTGAQ
jgi:hypothetical protein